MSVKKPWLFFTKVQWHNLIFPLQNVPAFSKTYQPEEQVWNISPLMEVCFFLLPTTTGDIRKNKTSSMIYKMNESTGKFILYHTLQTRGARRLE